MKRNIGYGLLFGFLAILAINVATAQPIHSQVAELAPAPRVTSPPVERGVIQSQGTREFALRIEATVLPANAKPLTIAGPATIPLYKIVTLTAEGDIAGAGFIWDVSPEDAADIIEYGKTIHFTGPAGTYKIKLRTVRAVKDGGLSIETVRFVVVIGEPGPKPPDPPDPKPPEPKPPEPKPEPATTPFPGDNAFRVLFLTESGENAQGTGIIYSEPVRNYLKTHCSVEGTAYSWRALDKDASTVNIAKVWGDAMKTKPASVPWVKIGAADGKRGWEGKLPATVDELLKKLKEFGGE